MRIEDDRIRIECDPASRIVVTHDTDRVQRRDADETPLTEADFDLRPDRGWFRVTVYAPDGSFAMTRAYYPEEYL